jgi:hypothetical protein
MNREDRLSGSETKGKLRREQMIVVPRTGSFLLKTVLQLELSMRCEPVSGRNIEPAEVLTPSSALPSTDVDLAEELLVPAKCAE